MSEDKITIEEVKPNATYYCEACDDMMLLAVTAELGPAESGMAFIDITGLHIDFGTSIYLPPLKLQFNLEELYEFSQQIDDILKEAGMK